MLDPSGNRIGAVFAPSTTGVPPTLALVTSLPPTVSATSCTATEPANRCVSCVGSNAQPHGHASDSLARDLEAGLLGMFVANAWYTLGVRASDLPEADLVSRLDVSVLQDRLLSSVLGITDPRRDQRIQFVRSVCDELAVHLTQQAVKQVR
ncbi:MAG TPA: hypothetical protein VNO30_30670 [Kofleriaceae bacterium]|nr:hypothetical protein [Kofleriaceae bacterium]